MRLASVLTLGCALAACAKPAPAAKDSTGLSPEETLIKLAALTEAGDEKGATALYSAEALKFAGPHGLDRLQGCKSTMIMTAGKITHVSHPEAKLKIEGIKPSAKFDGVYVVAAVYDAPGLPEAEHFPHFSYNFKQVNGHWQVVDDFKGL